MITGSRTIAEYSNRFDTCSISLVEVGACSSLIFRQLQTYGNIGAVAAGTLEQGFDLVRAMIQRGGRPTSCSRKRSGNW